MFWELKADAAGPVLYSEAVVVVVAQEIAPLEGVRAHDLRHVVVQLEDLAVGAVRGVGAPAGEIARADNGKIRRIGQNPAGRCLSISSTPRAPSR